MYLFNYLDRNALVNARLNDLEEEIGLVGTQYNTCVSILFVGYAPHHDLPLFFLKTQLTDIATSLDRSPPTWC